MLLRSMLFIPGNNMRMIHKAFTVRADAIILDLEDAVPLADKETARLFVRDILADLAANQVQTFVRLNGVTTGLLEEDIEWVVRVGLRGLILPKIEHAQEVRAFNQILSNQCAYEQMDPTKIAIIPQIESAMGLLNAYEIASAPGVVALAFGALDYTHDMGVSLSSDAIELLYPRAHLAVAARAAGVQAIDTPWFNLDDQEGLQREARLARQLGFAGKLLIHPRQITQVNTTFSPLDSEIEAAHQVVKIFEQAEEHGVGAVSFDGKMIDVASYRHAKTITARAEAIARQAKKNHNGAETS